MEGVRAPPRPGRSTGTAMLECVRMCVMLGVLYRAAAAGSNLPLLSGTLRTFQVHACDGAELAIECWPDTVIGVSLAHYGRQGTAQHLLCPASNHNATSASADCLSTHAPLRTVEETCRERRACRVEVSPLALGGDPCPGVGKYAEVAYKCRPNVFTNRVVCEGDRLRLRCHDNLRIVVYSASFGATHQGAAECPQPLGEARIEAADCQVSYATEAVMGICHGRRKCSVGADVGAFGHPGCPPGTRLFLKVVHTCVPKEILKELHIGRGAAEEEDEPRDDNAAPEPNTPSSSEVTPKFHMGDRSTTAKTDMQSDENNDEEKEDEERRDEEEGEEGGKVVGFLSEWMAAYHFVRENQEKFALCLTLGLSLAVVLVLVVLVARFYARRRGAPPPPRDPPHEPDRFDVEAVRFLTAGRPSEDGHHHHPRAPHTDDHYS